MAGYDGGAGTHDFTVGGVIARTIDVITRQWLLAIGLAILLSVLTVLSAPLSLLDGQEETTSLSVAAFLVPLFVSTFGGALLIALLTPKAIGHAFADPNAMNGSATTIAGLVPALFAATLLVAIGTGLGLMFFIVPGIIVMVAWSVTTPALVVERLGPIDAIGRSRDLTRGYRWPVLGLFLLAFALQAGLAGLSEILRGLELLSFSTSIWELNALDVLGSILGFLLWAPLAIGLYIELRLAKEGAPQSRYVDIFS